MSYTPFVITCNGRDGSTFLQTSIGSHPNAIAAAELLGPDWYPRNGTITAEEYLSVRLYKKYDPAIHAVGFRLKWYDGRKPPLDDVRRYLLDLGVRVIHVQRRNLLKQYVSLLVAQKTKIWVDRNGTQPSQVTIEVDPVRAVDAIYAYQGNYAKSLADFKSQESIVMYYEDLVEAYQPYMKKAFWFLGLRDFDAKPGTHRQEHRPLKQIIENYDQLEMYFSDTELERYLD